MKFFAAVSLWAVAALSIIVLYNGIAAGIVSFFYASIAQKFSLPVLSFFELWGALIITSIVFSGINPGKLLQIVLDFAKVKISEENNPRV